MPPQPIPEKFRRTRRVPLMVNEPEFELLTSLAEALDLDVGPALRRAVVETAAALYGRNTAMLKRYAAAIDGANE